MDRKLNYCRFELCKKPHEKRPIRREITPLLFGQKWLFLKVSKMAIFGQIAKGGPKENFQKSPIFWSKFGKLRKYKSYDSLISMDLKVYCRFELCKKPHEKRPIRHSIEIYNSKGGTKGKLAKIDPIFWSKFGKLKK